MAYLHLRPHVSYAAIGEHVVFLDLLRDLYLQLDADTQGAFMAAAAAAEPIIADGPVLSRLLATELFCEHSLRGRLTPASAPSPPKSLLDDTPQSARWSDLPRAWACTRRVKRRLGATPLVEIVSALRENRYKFGHDTREVAIEDDARRFLAARALVPIARSCLLDCLALLDWLEDDAPLPNLVFGVRMDPFAAHCWLQTDSVLLTDASDTVRAFVPVLVV